MSSDSKKQQTERTELRESVQQLWKYVPRAGSAVWGYSVPGRDHYSKQREALELLCGALWHLELGLEIRDLSEESIVTFCRKGRIPWEKWLERQKELSVDYSKDNLSINYHFREPADENIQYLIQSMLVADAALRLDGVRDVLYYARKNKDGMPEALSRRNKIAEWLDPSSATFTSFTTELQRQVIIVTTFRDYLMHGEIGALNIDVLIRYREQEFTKLSVPQILRACLGLWQELLTLTLNSET